ncbi:putative disease resistance protein [Quercus suber]|uniref:Disease resistance protein n=1 Tax=Quercus suber TaxID=58331 RepID=A0AAW0LVE5_QUESU
MVESVVFGVVARLVHKIGSEISDIKTKTSDLRSSFQNYGIREYSIGGGAFSLPSKKQRDGIRKLRDEEIVEKLRQVQQEKKCLVILDDIWNIEDGEILREAFPMKSTSSKILLTSCNGVVALYVDPRGTRNI